MRNVDVVSRYLQEGHARIDGWFYTADMLLFAYLGEIQDELGCTGDLCEVGVWHGKSLVLLQLMCSEAETAYGFDLFDDERIDSVRRNLLPFSNGQTSVILVKGNSQELTAEQVHATVQRPVRFLHIDAGHEFEEALHDLRLFSGLLNEGGVIAIDDYYDRDFPGVCAATHAFLDAGRSNRFVSFAAGQNKLYLCHPQYADRYIRALLRRPVFQTRLRLQSMYGRPMLLTFAGKLDYTHEEAAAQLNNWRVKTDRL